MLRLLCNDPGQRWVGIGYPHQPPHGEPCKPLHLYLPPRRCQRHQCGGTHNFRVIGISDDQAGFTAAEQAYKAFCADRARLPALRE